MKILSLSAFAFAALFVPAALPAQSPTSNVIISCVSKLTNVSRIVPSAASCNANTETSVTWNQQGPQGTTGATGAAGPAGATGPAGPQGTAGKIGPIGMTGPQGLPGKNGMAGPQGDAGPQGPAGPTGPQGATGDSLFPIVTWFTNVDLVSPFSTVDEYLSCPSGSVLVGTGCGARGYDTDSVKSLVVAAVGPDNNPGNANQGTGVITMTCKVYNNGAGDIFYNYRVAYSAACLSTNSKSTTSAAAAVKVYRMCSYDPETQQPCTKADAVVTEPGAALTAQPAAEGLHTAMAEAVTAKSAHAAALASGLPEPMATRKKVTLWFED